jgi:hypothetical protein
MECVHEGNNTIPGCDAVKMQAIEDTLKRMHTHMLPDSRIIWSDKQGSSTRVA